MNSRNQGFPVDSKLVGLFPLYSLTNVKSPRFGMSHRDGGVFNDKGVNDLRTMEQ